jgi:bifunctional DNase/RNase
MSEVPIRVWRVGRNSDSQYLVILCDDGDMLLPMTIGPCEALAIWSALRPRQAPAVLGRPGTHDLLCALIERLGGRLLKVVIDDLWNQVYYAKLHLAVNGEVLAVDARPSDSIALALRLGAPLFAAASVLEAARQEEEPPPDAAQPGPGPDSEGL